MTTVDAGVVVRADDGTDLLTDVFRPCGGGPASVVVTRTPYDRSALHRNGLGWARHGIAFVAQDVRGRYGSEGTWTPYRNERADGASLLRWVSDQPWCDGAVVPVGASYAAYTAWAAAVTAPDAVRAVVSQVPAMSSAQAGYDPSGILRLTEHAGWWSEHAEARTSRHGLASTMLGGHPELLRHLPVREIGDRLWSRPRRWWSAVAGGPADHGPEAVTDDELAACAVPTLHVGGWYDLFVAQTLCHAEIVGRSAVPRPPRALLVGPWAHELSRPDTSTVGAREHAPHTRLRLGELQVRWIRSALAWTPGRDTSDVGWTSVCRNGDDTWLDRWPPAVGTHTLHAHGDATLAPAPPRTAAAVGFRHDPADPRPSVLPGHDHAHLDPRADGLVFAGAPLARPLPVAGRPAVRLRATTSAPATDWVVTLRERDERGRAFEIARGVAVGARPPREIALTDCATTLPAGSRVELTVSSTDFPWLARNPGTGGDRYRAAELHGADQRVHTGPEHGTSVVLPVQEI